MDRSSCRAAQRTTAMVPTLSDPSQIALAPLRYLAQPGGEVPCAPEGLPRRREGLNRHRSDRADPRHRHQTTSLVVLPSRRPDFPVKASDLLAKPGQITAASAASFFCRLTQAFTQAGRTNRTAWPRRPISRPQRCPPPQASIATVQGSETPAPCPGSASSGTRPILQVAHREAESCSSPDQSRSCSPVPGTPLASPGVDTTLNLAQGKAVTRGGHSIACVPSKRAFLK